MHKLDLQSVPLEELWSLHEEIARILSGRISAHKRDLEQRLLKLTGFGVVGAQGVSPENGRRRRKYPRVFPKYRNPSMPEETWSGRGKRPRWLVGALTAGAKIEDFAICGEGGKSEGPGDCG
jgi:DNA-binding protein H-NS